MIITRAPLRVGLFGGGTDLPSFYNRHGFGKVVNFAIDKYVYVLIRKRYDNKIYLKYSKNEVVDLNKIEDIEHDFIRETLLFFKEFFDSGIEIINWADIPTKGTGLGSSSSFLVSLIKAISELYRLDYDRDKIAKLACHIEIKKCNKPIGIQDQYASAFGGLNCITIKSSKDKDELFKEIDVAKILKDDNELLDFSDFFQMYYTGFTRNSSDILKEQSNNMTDSKKFSLMKSNIDLVDHFLNINEDSYFNPHDIGLLMNSNWQIKRYVASGITNSEIDNIYKTATSYCNGGKITGAGGGGFFIFSVENKYKNVLDKEMANLGLKKMPFKVDNYGVRVLVNMEEHRW